MTMTEHQRYFTAARIDRARATEHVFGGVMATVLH